MASYRRIRNFGLVSYLFVLGACNSGGTPKIGTPDRYVSDAGGDASAGGSSTVGGGPDAASAGGSSTVGGGPDAAVGGSQPIVTAPDGTPQGPTQVVAGQDVVPVSLQQILSTASAMDGTAITSAYPAPVTKALTYDATTATGMSLLQASSLALNDSELSVLSANGMVITKRKTFPSFAYGYQSIYSQDLPVYVSADSILEAVHITFDTLLEQSESYVLIDELTQMLDGMRTRLVSANFDASDKADADLYLTLAESLLKGQLLTPLASADPNQLSLLYQLANAAQGHQTTTLFGISRDEDYSQFTPRGHYTDSAALTQYFKAMMWLGRVDFRLIETQGDGAQVFYRRQFDAAAAMHDLLGDTEYKFWTDIDATIGAYVGEHDNMTPKDLVGLLSALNVSGLADSNNLSDQQIIDEIQKGGWGAQRIASRIIVKADPSAATLPLDRSFALFGQRYTVDSNVLSNVSYDRVAGRMMPKPLDVAFAAFGNNSALTLLSPEFDNTSYVQALARTRALIDAHESAYWEGSLYTRWLGALRSLSPQDTVGLPSIAKTTAWQDRILSAQLGSWAQLRHNTLLYVKQSYSTGVSCEFPDGYVDPYPEFYAKLGAFADAVGSVTQSLPDNTLTASLKSMTTAWVSNFKTVTSNLQQMAQDQLTGTAHSADLIAFINDAVKWQDGMMCGGGTYHSNTAGWYLKLYLSPNYGIDENPAVVADVHTQPTDAAGNDVGRILHVGTGTPRLMVVTADTCQGPRAYVGLATSYGELIEENWKRLNDNDWRTIIATSGVPDVPWISAIISQ